MALSAWGGGSGMARSGGVGGGETAKGGDRRATEAAVREGRKTVGKEAWDCLQKEVCQVEPAQGDAHVQRCRARRRVGGAGALGPFLK